MCNINVLLIQCNLFPVTQQIVNCVCDIVIIIIVLLLLWQPYYYWWLLCVWQPIIGVIVINVQGINLNGY